MKKQGISQMQLEGLRDNPDKLIEIILKQAEMIQELGEVSQQVSQLEKHNGQLRKRIASLEKELKVPSAGPAPLRVAPKKRKTSPKQPGRAKGHKGSYRQAPQEADQVIEVPLRHCPECKSSINKSKAIEQHIIDLPDLKAVVSKLITHRGQCPKCKRQVCSSHPMQMTQSSGASGTTLGAKTIAVAAQLRYQTGLTLRKTCHVLKELLGINLSAGGLSQSMDRLAMRLKSNYQELGNQLRNSEVVHTDETGWWLNNKRASLWVMCNTNRTLYRVVENKTRATFHQTIPIDYKGVLVSDCLSVYDDATTLQHKCYAHHLKAISKAQEQTGGSNAYLQQWRALLKNAIQLKKERATLTPKEYEHKKNILHIAAKVLLEDRRENCTEESIRNRIAKQRDHLFVFLEHEGVDATNNLAERQLRPAVIRRKLSCGNKTRKGADSFEVLASLAATCQQQGINFLERVATAFALPASLSR